LHKDIEDIFVTKVITLESMFITLFRTANTNSYGRNKLDSESKPTRIPVSNTIASYCCLAKKLNSEFIVCVLERCSS